MLLLVFAAALAGLAPGATIRVPPGAQPAIAIENRHFDPPVTIDAHGATVAGLTIDGSSGIVWRGGTIAAPNGRGDIDSPDQKRGSGPAYNATTVSRSRNIAFDDVTFTNAKIGIVASRSRDLAVRNSRFVGLRSDGFVSVGNSHVLIENNHFHDTRPIPSFGSKADGDFVSGDHCDAIQIWAPDDVPVATDITIRGNLIEGSTQGINTFGPRGQGYRRIIVENNTVRITYPAAISVMGCTDCRVRYNTVASAPGANRRANLRTDESTGLFCENRMLALPKHRAAAKCPVPAQ